MKPLQNKTLIMVIGPTSIGKTALMNDIATRYPDFGRVSGFTSRGWRPDDEPGMHRYVSYEEARQLTQDTNTVQYAIHPTTGAIYGSQLVDYPKSYNMLDTLSTAVADLQALPFRQTLRVSLAAPAAEWVRWFTERYPNLTNERLKRLEEARQSIEWSLAQTSGHYWLVNTPNQLQATGDELVATVLGRSQNDHSQPPAEAMELLAAVTNLLS